MKVNHSCTRQEIYTHILKVKALLKDAQSNNKCKFKKHEWECILSFGYMAYEKLPSLYLGNIGFCHLLFLKCALKQNIIFNNYMYRSSVVIVIILQIFEMIIITTLDLFNIINIWILWFKVV